MKQLGLGLSLSTKKTRKRFATGQYPGLDAKKMKPRKRSRPASKSIAVTLRRAAVWLITATLAA